MNVIKEFSTFRVTSHVALREAVNLVTPERITSAIRLADDTLRAAGHAEPRIGVAALNPHNGENGLFGDEEIRIIRPTVEKMRAEGVNCTGPISSDAIFIKARRGRVRRRGDDVPRPGPDRDQAARLQQGRHRDRRA